MDFGTVLIVVAVLAVVVAAASYWGAGRVYGDIGRGDFEMDHTPAGPPGAGSEAEAREEIRQMLEAKAARRAARGRERSMSRPSWPPSRRDRHSRIPVCERRCGSW